MEFFWQQPNDLLIIDIAMLYRKMFKTIYVVTW